MGAKNKFKLSYEARHKMASPAVSSTIKKFIKGGSEPVITKAMRARYKIASREPV